jgi:ABC-2 type transport system ATP-binding protein
MGAIVADDLARAFSGGVVAVAGIDLDVAEGEIYAFLGPNGAGKTTSVRMLTTLLRPTGGRATVAGHDVVAEASAVRRTIGVALQEAALDPLMSGRELMRLQSALHAVPRREVNERSDALIERVGLTHAADRRVGTYSGGMRRRLDLAMALVHAPRVLFLDEPTTGLDPASRSDIWREVRALNDEGTTVFLTTQYLEEADQLADRVGIIDEGLMVAEGTPERLKAEIGKPSLEVCVSGDRERAKEVLSRFGPVRPGSKSSLAVPLEERSGVTDAVRALDEAGLMVDSLEVKRPTLDDVFLAKTGHALTEAEEAAAAAEAEAEAEPRAPAEAGAAATGSAPAA